MSNEDLKLLLQIAKSKIDKGETFDDVKIFIVSNHGNEIFSKIENEIIEHIQRKEILGEKNKSYWMLISNPSKWGNEPEYMFNDTIFNLDKNNIIEWSINKHTDISFQMKEGELGIIKVSEDSRTISQRTDSKGNIVPILEAGIYAIFEIVQDDDGFITFEDENGDYRVNIKVVDNFFNKGKQISKEKSIEILGETKFKSMSSVKIDKKQFEIIKSLEK
jgi:hypothetical protein